MNAIASQVVQINAWTGQRAANAEFGEATRKWTFRQQPSDDLRRMAPAAPADPADWTDDRVGWGIVLKDNPAESTDTLASGDDAPAPIRELLAHRVKQAEVSVLRYLPDSPLRWTVLRNYKTDQPVDITRCAFGTGPAKLPRHLLIVGSPQEIPWNLQYTLNAKCAVGRLDLPEAGLANYVAALKDNWSGSHAEVCQPVVWSVNHATSDITQLMHDSIAARVAAKLAEDGSIGAKLKLLDAHATVAHLQQGLTDNRPALVVTTSHGMTGPIDDAALMADNLGLLVDYGKALCRPASLDGWEPDGAVWYAHACCSAGSDERCNFSELVPDTSSIAEVLKAVADLGSRVAPFPKALLGAAKPLRGFIGHVEPTFDWTLRNPLSGQMLTDILVQSLYEELGRGLPLGLGLQPYFQALGPLYDARDGAIRDFNHGRAEAEDTARVALLTARDIRSTVLLGDPLAALPPIP